MEVLQATDLSEEIIINAAKAAREARVKALMEWPRKIEEEKEVIAKNDGCHP